MKILAISGSLRTGSYNTALCKAIQELGSSKDVEIEVVTLHDIPMFNQDLETPSNPPVVDALKQKVKEVDALIISTPEYNNMVPGVLKNALEWLSRKGGPELVNKPVAIMGASDGGFGTVRSQNQLLLLCSILKMKTSGTWRLPISRAQDMFDAKGNLTDDHTKQKIVDFVTGFIQAVSTS